MDTEPEAVIPPDRSGSSCQWTTGKEQIFCVGTETDCDNLEKIRLLLHNGGKGGVSLDLRGFTGASLGGSISTDHKERAIAESQSTQSRTPQGEYLGHLLTK